MEQNGIWDKDSLFTDRPYRCQIGAVTTIMIATVSNSNKTTLVGAYISDRPYSLHRLHLRAGPWAHPVVALFSGSALVSINEVTLRWARLVLGWVTVCGRVNHLTSHSGQLSLLPSAARKMSIEEATQAH